MDEGFSRRTALAVLAAGTLAPRAVSAAEVCPLTPEAVEGPFYLDPRLVRADIREDRPGVPLDLRLRVVATPSCGALAGARVDVWHADAQGRYSGYPGQGDRGASTVGRTFLRGTQFTDREGVAAFRTIYPGWYPGRTTHVHVKVILDTRTALTGQIYFPDPANAAVHDRAPAYGGRPARGRITNGRDGLLREDDPERRGMAQVLEEGEGYAALLTLGVRRAGA
ncbi:intradiol ring-cleavage dioxygenase [Methylobacterium oryzisoli]|uniref:intradiol ring-cleavage dioxygenase n=1 Tax=Methylobacterium oryzisoli TaxID=3385502 RepID=UPI0038914B1C